MTDTPKQPPNTTDQVTQSQNDDAATPENAAEVEMESSAMVNGHMAHSDDTDMAITESQTTTNDTITETHAAVPTTEPSASEPAELTAHPTSQIGNTTSVDEQNQTNHNNDMDCRKTVTKAADTYVHIGTIRLPNARQNQPYCVVLTEQAEYRDLHHLHLIDDAGTTLSIDSDEQILSGTPINNGECALSLRGTFSDGTDVVLTLAILINPDPRTLWHDIEPKSPLFRKPHRDWQHAADARASMTAARVRGRSHAHKGSFCEDDIAIVVDGDGVGYIGMVADGAGSSRFSRLASQVLCTNLPRHLCHEVHTLQHNGELAKLYALFDDNDNRQQQGLTHIANILANAVKRALQDLLEHTRLAVSEGKNQPHHPLTLKDLYSTCLAFWALPLVDGRWILASYWVGDGGLAVQHGNDFTLLGIPDGGEFSGQTRFLAAEETTDVALRKRLRTGIYHDLQSVWALTDGITDAKFASEQQLEDSAYWQDLTDDIAPALDSADSLYEWLGFWSQGNHDDRSLCVLRIQPNHTNGSKDE